MDIENVSSYPEYRQYVKEMCDIIENEYDIANANDPHEIIHQNVDSDKSIIYYDYHLTIIQHSDSEPEEWQIYVDDNEKNHKKYLQAMAYATLMYDVTQELSDRDLI